MSNYVFAVDPSLTCSGWALFSVTDERLIGVGKLRSMPSKYTLATRLQDLQTRILGLIEQLKLSERDVLICEAATTMQDPRAAFKVEQVRGIFESVARLKNIQVPGRIHPRTVQFEIMGLTGRQLRREGVKETAIHTVKALYQDALSALSFDVSVNGLKRNQDIVDAVLIGALALSKIKRGLRAGVELEQLFVKMRAGWQDDIQSKLSEVLLFPQRLSALLDG